MAITDESNGFYMPVAPAYAGGNSGFGNFGGDWGWIILLLLCANGGWGGFGGFGGMGGFAADGAMLYPWMNQAEVTTNGFQNLSTQNQITAVQSDLGDIQTQLCNGFAGVNATINSGFANAETAENARQMASMQQLFALSQQFADCCCENRLAACQTQNTISSEAAATRYANATNTRDILENQNRNNQAVLDKLCQLELDAKNDKIADLQRELTAEQFKASQIAQNAFISQGFADEVDQLYNRLSNCPVPTTPVYGRTPIFTCGGNNCGTNCGCGIA